MASIPHFEKVFRDYKALSEKALGQLAETEWFIQPGSESNSAAALVKHMSGNLRSRFTDFFTTDGEKEDRNRDGEFITEHDTVSTLKEEWEHSWQILFDLFAVLKEEDMDRIVYIRAQPHTVLQAMLRQVAHYAYHSGQIVYLVKMIRNDDWQNLSVPRNGSEAYMAEMRSRAGNTYPPEE